MLDYADKVSTESPVAASNLSDNPPCQLLGMRFRDPMRAENKNMLDFPRPALKSCI
jgi:hypothetical protein